MIITVSPNKDSRDVNLSALLALCPEAGGGLSAYLCKVANTIRHDWSEDEGFEILFNLAVDRGYTEKKARYHAERLRRKWHESPGGQSPRRYQPKIKPNLNLIYQTVGSSNLTVAAVAKASPVKIDPADTSAAGNIVDLLLFGEIVCVGSEKFSAYCDYSKNFEDLCNAQFLVPNPMCETGIYEHGKEWRSGKASPKRDDNVLYQKWLVVEFDIARYGKGGKTRTFWADLLDNWEQEGISAQDAQVRLIQSLTGHEFDLAMIIFSGSKSLHSWWKCAGASQQELDNFISRALKVGADPAVRTPSQYFRLPGGWNHNKQARQQVIYLNLTKF
jgi:hypothetical protein